MAKPTEQEVVTLHRYFIYANRMRTEFDSVLARSKELEHGQFLIESQMYMSLWYGLLYVVVEAWKDLGLEDDLIDDLLKSPNIPLLRRYRNAVFHFQREYYDEKVMDLINDGENVVIWIRSLNEQFGRFFLEWFKERRKTEFDE